MYWRGTHPSSKECIFLVTAWFPGIHFLRSVELKMWSAYNSEAHHLNETCVAFSVLVQEGLLSVLLSPAFTLVSCSAYSSTLKMKAICSSETLVDFQRTTRRYISDDSTLHYHRCEILKSYTVYKMLKMFLNDLAKQFSSIYFPCVKILKESQDVTVYFRIFHGTLFPALCDKYAIDMISSFAFSCFSHAPIV
jgi:hypothetical protein